MLFSDIFKAPHYYKQAVAACKAGITTGRSDTLLYYSDEQLTYMLLHANGDFHLTELMPEGLLQLLESRNDKESPDYWETLRVLLDNEMNASQTARDLYLHRSSFLNRMKKINDTVRLDTPEERLHLRMCICLYEILHKNRE